MSSSMRKTSPDAKVQPRRETRGLGIDQATVQTAFDELDAAREADHTAREQAMYASVAEALGKTTAEVQAAFEANRPAKPTS